MTIDPAAGEVALAIVCLIAAFYVVGKVVSYIRENIFMDRD